MAKTLTKFLRSNALPPNSAVRPNGLGHQSPQQHFGIQRTWSRAAAFAGIWGASCIAACTFMPAESVPPEDAQADQKLADESAAEQTPPGFAPAEELGTASTTQAQSYAPPLITVGFASLTITQHPPFSVPSWFDTPTDSSASEHSAPTSWRPVRTLWVGAGYLHEAEFTPDQKQVLTLSERDGTIYRYDVATGKQLSRLTLPDYQEFSGASFAVLREVLTPPQAVIVDNSGARLLDIESGRLDRLDGAPPGHRVVHSGRFGLYGVMLRETTPQSGIVDLRWADGILAARLECQERPDDFALSSDGTLLAVTYYPSNLVQLIDLEKQELLGSFPCPKWGGSVALSADKRLLALGGEKLVVLRLPEGEMLFEDADYQNNISNIRFTPDATLLLVSAYDGKARSYVLSDANDPTTPPRPQILAHRGSANVYALGLSADARLLVTSSGDQTLKIWRR
jgi:WD40 repeat protein